MTFALAIPRFDGLLRQYGVTQGNIARSLERLSTGKRINHASDDPAGTIAVAHLNTDAIVLQKKIDGLEQKNHYLAARDGAETALGDLLIDLNGLTVRAANRGALADGELDAMQIEADSILEGIDFIMQTSQYKGQQLFMGAGAGSLGGVTGPAGSEDDDAPGKHYTLADLRKGGALDLLSGDLELAQKVTEAAVSGNAHSRATIGTAMKSNESEIRQHMIELEGVTGEQSRIEDTDYAAEISELVRNQVLGQAQLAMMSVGRQSAQTVLNLLGSVSGVTPAKIAGA